MANWSLRSGERWTFETLAMGMNPSTLRPLFFSEAFLFSYQHQYHFCSSAARPFFFAFSFCLAISSAWSSSGRSSAKLHLMTLTNSRPFSFPFWLTSRSGPVSTLASSATFRSPSHFPFGITKPGVELNSFIASMSSTASADPSSIPSMGTEPMSPPSPSPSPSPPPTLLNVTSSTPIIFPLFSSFSFCFWPQKPSLSIMSFFVSSSIPPTFESLNFPHE
mmetsp:Transcript_72142/g.203843  ORF Transcript_72142/g.203843 Transcript_72142/m.203843 type:complete len:220 (+) Transcript_72142:363-1022(+)